MRDSIRLEVASILPFDEIEIEHRREVLAWIDSGVELCRLAKPASPPVHLVSYFALIDEGHMLLVEHRNAQLWRPTGGHVEPGEHPRVTVVRELLEELRIDYVGEVDSPLMVTSTKTVGVTAGHTDVSLWYALRGDRTHALEFDSSEFLSVCWYPFDDIPFERSDPHMRRFVTKLRADRSLREAVA